MRDKKRKAFRVATGAWVVALSLCSFSVAAEDWIGQFYTDAGAALNVTRPNVIATQQTIGATGGGLVWRVPNKIIAPVQISPPSLKAGCGGIDMYLGSYSFPNKEEFVQALRNFGQAALGYFFQLALRTMAPEIATTLDYINNIANEMNQFSMNSCSAAKKFVDTVAGPLMESHARSASGFKRFVADTADEFGSWFGVSGAGDKIREGIYESTYHKKPANVSNADVRNKKYIEGNILRYALDTANVNMSEDEKDLAMSLIGPTLIIAYKTDNPTGKTTEETIATDGHPSTITFKDLVGIDKDPTASSNLSILTCGSSVGCKAPYKSNVTTDSFRKRVHLVLSKISQNILLRQKVGLSASEESILKLSSVPLYRAAGMSASHSLSAAVLPGLYEQLVDYAAIDAAIHFVNHYLSATERSLEATRHKVEQIHHPGVDAIIKRISTIREAMYEEVKHYSSTHRNPYQVIEMLDNLEKQMYNTLNVQLAANAHFLNRQ